MDVAALSIVMSQSKVQQDAGMAVMKMAMDSGKETAAQMTKMMSDISIDPNLGNNVDRLV
ncbi:YjfB family protein [Clostridium sp. LBM24168]